MNANLPQRLLAINDWLLEATTELQKVGIDSARLDAEIILAHTIRKPRTYIHAHPEVELTSHQQEIADARLELRRTRTPIAYIIGHKEFYGRRFKVTPATLIPRPESEDMIRLLKEVVPQTVPLLPSLVPRLVDVGTGSGCLGITAKLELPQLDVTLSDTSRYALKIADFNSKHLEAEVTILESNLLTSYSLTANYILANLPYVDPEWKRSPETNYEPADALFADDNGLQLILKFIQQSVHVLASRGYLLIEADPRQHDRIKAALIDVDFKNVTTCGFIVRAQKS